MSEPRPDRVFDVGLQHERTALAWERTAVAMMVAGVLLARYATTIDVAVALVGLVAVALGGALMLWAGWHYEELHGPLRGGESVVHPGATRFVGLFAVAFSVAALVVATIAVAIG